MVPAVLECMFSLSQATANICDSDDELNTNNDSDYDQDEEVSDSDDMISNSSSDSDTSDSDSNNNTLCNQGDAQQTRQPPAARGRNRARQGGILEIR